MASHAVDTEYLVRRSMSKGYQLFSLLSPPIYTAFILARRGRSGFSINRLLRATWVGGAAGCAAAGSFEYVRSAYSNDESVRYRRLQNTYNMASIRADDHSTIGVILFAVLTPAVFWKRARAIHLILGGAGIGSSVGILTHYARTLSGDPPPSIEIPSLPAASRSNPPS